MVVIYCIKKLCRKKKLKQNGSPDPESVQDHIDRIQECSRATRNVLLDAADTDSERDLYVRESPKLQTVHDTNSRAELIIPEDVGMEDIGFFGRIIKKRHVNQTTNV